MTPCYSTYHTAQEMCRTTPTRLHGDNNYEHPSHCVCILLSMFRYQHTARCPTR